jgi:hypothetical protein
VNDKTIIRVQKDKNNPYAMINTEFLNNDAMSWKAKGILTYLLTKPDGWKVIAGDLIKRSKDGRDAVYSALRELKSFRHLEKYPVRDKGRIIRWESIIHEIPYTENPQQIENKEIHLLTENPYMEKPNMEKPYMENPQRNNIYISNKDFNNNSYKQSKFKTKFHLKNSRLDKYTPEQLNNIVFNKNRQNT